MKKLLLLPMIAWVLFLAGCGQQPVQDQEIQTSKTPEEISKESVEKCFDTDGMYLNNNSWSIERFDNIIKDQMHDDTSFELVKATHEWKWIDNTDVYISYRWLNALGNKAISIIEFKTNDECIWYMNSFIEDWVQVEFDSWYAIPPTP